MAEKQGLSTALNYLINGLNYLNSENKPIKTRKGDLPNNRSFSFNYYNTYKSCLKKLEIG